MTKKLIGTALALAMGTGMALAAVEENVVIDVEGELVEVPIGTAAVACDMEADAVEAFVGGEAPVCQIDQATADEHGIAAGAG